MIPNVIEPQIVSAVDGEPDVLENVLYGLNQLLVGVGYSSYLSNNPYTNTRWYQSRGESGDHNVVFGICPITDSSRLRLMLFTASDLNTFGATVGVSSLTTVAGHVNDDNTSVVNVSGASAGPRFSHPQPGGTAFNSGVTPREPTSSIEFWACANKDRFILFEKYLSSNLPSQAVLAAGMLPTVLSNELHKTARARIYSITNVGGTVWEVTLDRFINNAINDITMSDPDPYATRLFFQTVATSASEIASGTGYAQTQRVQIVPGSLTVDGNGRTVFRVDAAAQVKLWATGNRYARATPLGTILSPGNGLGDIVSVTSDPNFAIALGRNDGGAYINGTQTFMVAAWRNNGGQRAFTPNATPGNNAASFTACQLLAANTGAGGAGQNLLAAFANEVDPSPSSNRTPPFCIYLAHSTVSDSSVLPNTDGDAREPLFYLPDLLIAPKVIGVPDRAIGTREAKVTERYRFMEFIPGQGLGSFTTVVGAPGSFQYQHGIRGEWV